VIKFVSDFVTGWWFSLGTLVSSINKTDSHDITEISLKVVLNTITPRPNYCINYASSSTYRSKHNEALKQVFSVNADYQKLNICFTFFQDLSSFVTKSIKEIEHVMNVGNANRVVG
jgi:hypothetical protein